MLSKRKQINPLEFVELMPQQLRIINDPTLTKVAGGGNRSSKSFLGAVYIIKKCLAKPKQRWWACAETFADSVNIQQRKIYDVLPKNETRFCYYDEVNGFRHRKLIFKNGSQIHFKSYDQNRESFQGDDLDGAMFDEEPPHDIYKETRMRLIDRNGEMLFTMTSLKGMTELMQELFEEHEVIEERYAEHLKESLPVVAEKNGIRFYALWTTDNKHVNQARVAEEIKLMTAQEIKSRIYGIPTNLSGRIYPMFNKKVHIIPNALIPKRRVTIYNVLDPHDRKPWAMTWWAVDKTGTAYCIREYPWRKNFNDMESDDKTYDDYVRVIENTEKDIMMEYGRSVSRRIIDPNFGNKTVQLSYRVANQAHTTPQKELAKRGLVFRDGIDSLEIGHLQVRKWLSWEEKDGQITKQPRLFISDECENTARHLSRYSRKDIETSDGDMKDKVGVHDKYKDFSDTTRYFVMSDPRYIERVTQAPEPTGRLY